MSFLSGIVVVAFALFLIGLAATIYTRPSHAERFLLAFARSARAHYTEQTARLVIGGALVMFSSGMRHPDLFRFFGWIIVLTSIILLCLPWRWHRRFAHWVVPPVVRHLKLFGFGAAVLGGLLLYGLFAPVRAG